MARIRTIKPEFWSHPVMARQDDSTRLMAIALLNYADDEGYFHAEPNLVRGFARPFDDNSTITRRCLDNLSKIGFISINNNPDYGLIGMVEKFSEHQKIDRPTDSKLKSYYSWSTRRVLDEDSLLERKGREQGKERNINDQFQIFWDSYHSITGKLKTDRDPAFKYWNKLTEDERKKALNNIQSYFNSISDKKYCKKARTYLADKNFNDELHGINKGSTQPTGKSIGETTPGLVRNPDFVRT